MTELYRETIARLEAENRAGMLSIADWRQACERARAEVERLRAERDGYERAWRGAEVEVDGLEQSVEELKRERDGLDTDLVRLKGAAAEVEFYRSTEKGQLRAERDRLGATAALLRDTLELTEPLLGYPTIVRQALAADPDEWLRAHDAAIREPYRAAAEALLFEMEDCPERLADGCKSCNRAFDRFVKHVRPYVRAGAPQDGPR